jgi:purine nucleosidase/pyrimidine-specific ribonucleoside hydrolase
MTLSHRDAVHEILHQLSIASEPITVITLGPLTNIAAAIEKDRTTMAKINRIVLMGGAISVPGNITSAAEFNIYFDPHAASIVFNAGIPLTVVGLDVTRRVRLMKGTVTEAYASCKTAVNRFIYDCTEKLFAFVDESDAGESGLPLHDPLAVGVAIDPAFVTTEAMPVEVETEGEFTEGMLVADRRPANPARKKSPNADVSVDVDASRFISFFLGRVLGQQASE